ncbi:hypothetical protein RF11_11540 [Thelohanellus kitauei]|uniref:Uncharacterized protein n=1 Tax=Thelohanellus kitauei TaxID=669202 RepID=A0A0C2JUF8_THEKT|nr:hypothetical protein RF11_11540 [Thelohanellus kitauei]
MAIGSVVFVASLNKFLKNISSRLISFDQRNINIMNIPTLLNSSISHIDTGEKQFDSYPLLTSLFALFYALRNFEPLCCLSRCCYTRYHPLLSLTWSRRVTYNYPYSIQRLVVYEQRSKKMRNRQQLITDNPILPRLMTYRSLAIKRPTDQRPHSPSSLITELYNESQQNVPKVKALQDPQRWNSPHGAQDNGTSIYIKTLPPNLGPDLSNV